MNAIAPPAFFRVFAYTPTPHAQLTTVTARRFCA
jgi:hypothetical protein